MGFFDALNSIACDQALKNIESFRRRRGASSYDVIQALKCLASAHRLYRIADRNYYSDNRLEYYFWEKNGHLVNIHGEEDELPNSQGRNYNYEPVSSSECTTEIDCSI